ncbi:MAG: histidinol-phosphate transaminase [Bacteroidales bacterium]|nr:histidinol-phosphate transaminase [Bacteroidales bacterium]
MDISKLIRKNIASLAPYSCARNEFEGEARVFLDANENPYNEPYNRYPDPLQRDLKRRIAEIKGVRPGQIFLGNGSDESIDLAFRAFCEPREDNVVAIAPTYGMYQVSADINDVEYRKVLLDDNYSFKAASLLAACDGHTKLIFICSPNNPTGNSMPSAEIRELLERFEGLVVVDEAYIDFSSQPSLLAELDRYPNLLVFQTFSKAWGSAGLRLGLAFASEEIIGIYNKIKYPYNINMLTQRQLMPLLESPSKVRAWVAILLEERARLAAGLQALKTVRHIYPSDANFLLVKVDDPVGLYNRLVGEGIIVRNRHGVRLCEGCLRITVGTPRENDILLDTLKQWEK